MAISQGLHTPIECSWQRMQEVYCTQYVCMLLCIMPCTLSCSLSVHVLCAHVCVRMCACVFVHTYVRDACMWWCGGGVCLSVHESVCDHSLVYVLCMYHD